MASHSNFRKKKSKASDSSKIALISFLGLAVMFTYPDLTRTILSYNFIVIFLFLIVYLLYRSSPYKFRFRIRPLNPNMVEVDYMNGIDFEHFLKPLFEAKGIYAEVTHGRGDFRADLILTRKGKKTVVQAKCYSSNIGVSVIQQAVAAIPFYSAHNAIVVTNQYYTKQAKQLAKVNRIKLIDRDELIDMITVYKGGTTSIFNRLLAPFRLRLDRD